MSADHVTTSFCSLDDVQCSNDQPDDVVDLLPSSDPQRGAATTDDKPTAPDQSSDTASDEDFEDDDDERRADLSLPDEALRHELDLFRTTRAMLNSVQRAPC